MQNRKQYKSTISIYRLVGILAILLPFLCMLGGYFFDNLSIQKSVSFYYYTSMRDLYVGILVTLAFYFLAYKKYGIIDNIITSLTSIFILGIILFPCMPAINSNRLVGLFRLHSNISDIIHMVFATLCFSSLATISLYLFTKTNIKVEKRSRKKIRNVIHRVCGISIIISIVCIAVSFVFLTRESFDQHRIALIFEIIMLLAFGISWLVKGEIVFKDKKDYINDRRRAQK